MRNKVIHYILRIFGIIKLCIYNLFGYHIRFHISIFFHPSSKIIKKGKCNITFGRHVQINRNCEISCNQGGICYLEDNVVIKPYSYIEVGKDAELRLEQKVFLNRNSTIVCMGKIQIQKNVAIGNAVQFYDHDHVYVPDEEQQWAKSKRGTILVERDVWIGAGCILLRGTVIEHNSTVAAGSIVKTKIPANTLYFQEKAEVFREIGG